MEYKYKAGDLWKTAAQDAYLYNILKRIADYGDYKYKGVSIKRKTSALEFNSFADLLNNYTAALSMRIDDEKKTVFIAYLHGKGNETLVMEHLYTFTAENKKG